MANKEMDDAAGKVRIDKWLWAARFFKTRGLAADAIDGGKIRYDGERPKPAKEVKLGAVLRITRSDGEWEVIVRGLSGQRRGAPEASLLYEETEQSRQRREQAALTKEADHAMRDHGMGRPTKRDRRLIKRFNEGY
ncbi:RNA-binding protein [Methylobacillus sp. MM3]|uniref:RNA-binding S4 domain-containing protein n=1 Tax=Methylobacillus sp. MM3 TaxID=1848039 RepID=UPI0007E09314|nr:S4 domain-containing protein [Methylobacillus sp. MM3]OAJ71233.1 RNA-binding protein [Methylobacillus sp. MM3]